MFVIYERVLHNLNKSLFRNHYEKEHMSQGVEISYICTALCLAFCHMTVFLLFRQVAWV